MSAEVQPFKFKQFSIHQECSAMKVGTDGVLLGAWADVQGMQRILDVGSGTGVIAIMLAQRNTDARVIGVEIDEEASREAAANMNATPFSDRLEIISSPIQDFAWNHKDNFDLIVSNPPFYSGGTLSFSAGRNDVRHTTKLSHGDLIQSVNRLLHPQGTFCIVLPHLEGLRFIEFAQRARLHPQRITEVIPRAEKSVNRLLVAFGREPISSFPKDQLIIRAEGDNFTEAYKELTKDFYLNF